MPGRTDRPGADEPGGAADGDRPRGPQDELRRRLANLPASHPSSPRYRAGRSGGSGGDQQEDPRRVRSGESGVNRAGPDVTGAAAAAAARAARGQPRQSGGQAKDRRAADDALWAQAARWQAAAQARREARGTGGPSAPPPRREPFRPWFTESAGEDLWLNAEGTGEPWFTGDGEGER